MFVLFAETPAAYAIAPAPPVPPVPPTAAAPTNVPAEAPPFPPAPPTCAVPPIAVTLPVEYEVD